MPSLGHTFGKGQGTGELGERGIVSLGRATLTVISRRVACCVLLAGSRTRLKQVSKQRSVSDGIRASKRREDGQDEKKCRQGKDRQKGG